MADGKNDKEQRRQQQAEDGRKAMLDYEAEAAALRARTEKLRALRLARDAASPPAPKARARKTSASGGRVSKAKPQPLSDWLSDQRKDGRRD